MAHSSLTYNDGPMVWVDCEMTGLDTNTDRIIEIAVIITDGHLRPVDEGVEWVIHTPKEVLDEMGEWCTEQHGKSGLTQACIDSPHSYEDVAAKVLEYIKRWIPEKGAGLLAGSSVHADMRFLLIGMPEVMKHLSYRIVDCSSELARRWYPNLIKQERAARPYESAHRALDDIRASIRELEFYQKNIFKPLETEPTVPESRDTPLKTAI
ncbi:uncharacterized protein EHS24_005188 [Apiotrichum porosum]|uniref:Exonuclease domain-containing protein n=1 Tax=Apiotrichum porosum TaxID=105984 RepID=A0A427Y740_9TREE|nr:uncharacterized protein EHS24_005188 [Apiotrichum porosum]RSH86910.1 hypothetical protein EHS24_005188 [Apiotrichum porosum]